MNKAPYLYPDYQLAVFSKVPALGKVKTRMQPGLSQDFSLSLHRQLVSHCLDEWASQKLLPVKLWLAGDMAKFDREFPPYRDLPKQQQSGADLGERMALAVKTALEQQAKAVILVGTDCPFIDVALLEKVCRLLQKNDAVIVPAEDSGYVLLGLKSFRKEIFTGIEWGTDTVLADTLSRLEHTRTAYAELPALPDIDRPEDLALLKPLPAFATLAEIKGL